VKVEDIVKAELARQAAFGYEPSWLDFVIAGQQAGIREVVEWVEEKRYKTSRLEGDVMLASEDWQAFLKEHGIDTDKQEQAHGGN